MEAILCHELGHHLYGGGQEELADYFVMEQCLPVLWRGQLHSYRYDNTELHKLSFKQKSSCASYNHPELCYRASLAFDNIMKFRFWVWDILNVRVDEDQMNYCRWKSFDDGMHHRQYRRCG